MRIDTDFTIEASPEDAYRLLLDLEQVAPCIPGGELGAEAEDGSYAARVTVKLGPMKLVYEGSVRIAEADDAARRAVLLASAREARGQGGAEAQMTMRVSPSGDGARVEIATELQLSGRAAQMGRGIVEDVARKLVGDMAECLRARFPAGAAEAAASSDGSGPPAGPAQAVAAARPIGGVSLALSLVWGRIRKLLKGDRDA